MLQRAQRALDGRDELLVGEVEPLAPHDPCLRLDRDLRALGRREPQRLGEARLAVVLLLAVHSGVVEEVDPGVPRGPDKRRGSRRRSCPRCASHRARRSGRRGRWFRAGRSSSRVLSREHGHLGEGNRFGTPYRVTCSSHVAEPLRAGREDLERRDEVAQLRAARREPVLRPRRAGGDDAPLEHAGLLELGEPRGQRRGGTGRAPGGTR